MLVTAACIDGNHIPNPPLWGHRLLEGNEAGVGTESLLLWLSTCEHGKQEARKAMLAALLSRFTVLAPRPSTLGALAAIFRTEFLETAAVPESSVELRHFPHIVSTESTNASREKQKVRFVRRRAPNAETSL